MVAFLMTLLIILAIFLIIAVLIQPGKGDMGLGSLAGKGSQMLFGGSGGRDMFEKITWTMGIIFIFACLGLTILKTKDTVNSRLKNVVSENFQQPKK